MMQTFTVIAAADSKWGIGKDGLIPWRYPEDFKWFKRATLGATCFMGRTSYDEIAGMMVGKKELLPGRKCVVFTSRPLDDDRVTVCSNINDYATHATEKNFFIGGTSIFRFGLTVADAVYVTKIPGFHKCNVFFPFKELFDSFVLNNETRLTDSVDSLTVAVYNRK